MKPLSVGADPMWSPDQPINLTDSRAATQGRPLRDLDASPVSGYQPVKILIDTKGAISSY